MNKHYPKLNKEAEISPDLNGLQPLLQKLDRLIIQAKEKIESTEISPQPTSIQLRSDSLLAWLQKTFNLSNFDLYILTIALAPELDKQYERVYIYLQDDISHKRPTVDLVFSLLCSTIPEKLSRRKHFSTNSPLIHNRLLYLSSEATLLSQHLILDAQVIRLLLNQHDLDSRLVSCCQLLEQNQSAEFSDSLYLQEDLQNKLQTIVKEDWQKQPLLLYFQGIDSLGKRRTAQVLAQTLEVPLLVADLEKILEDKPNFESKLQILFREAWFFNRLLYIDNFEILNIQENQVYLSTFLKQLENNRSISILSGIKNWIPTTNAKGVIIIPFTIPESEQRRKCWINQLQAAKITIEDKELDILSNRFRLTPDQISDAVITAYNNSRWQSNTTAFNQIFNHLCSAARSQSGHELTTLARKVEPKYSWDDIILHPNQLKQLRDICKEAEYQNLVHQQWGFAEKLSLGKGLNVLFSGSPGTGKTMAAEVIAAHLQLDLYKIDLSQIVSKYIGDTEKNLNRIFTAAANSNAILLFDEADALFGKRSEVKDSRDRYANIEVGYLLQKMEEYEGIAILTTNARSNMDEAFERRLRFIIEFQLPDAKNRHLIWQRTFPENAPCSPDLDLEFLAQNFEITGANIRNIALSAAFLAADDGGIIEMVHLVRAMRREYQKMGQVLRDKDLGEYLGLR
ncbi:ATPase central domain-containing protein [Calothrix parasitica NIES-267]|uniref:ATPase central domain-containing protein n=1 Tax=Calothrix parasitica NIES-267 TaxID=1973488 RepID=A0A1Z4LU58_9CYAN|nr:ATPase central domain-containing protein [Calothrix parasitica NIES-267]